MKHHYRIFHFFCGLGGSAIGAGAASARVTEHDAEFETVGGIDLDPLACADFSKLTGAPAWCRDVTTLQPAELRALVPECPDVVMSSPPCKGYSGLLSAKRAQEKKYQEMNRLMVRALFLLTSTWERPPALIFFENVPRIESRGADVVAQCKATLEAAGYAVATGSHDCGELGGLAQHRRRWFLLARHRARVDQFIYQPPSLRVRGCGEVLGQLAMPGDVAAAGAMHAVPRLSWRNWVRLALIPAGGDWRDLPGVLAEGQARREKFRRAPVTAWADPAETVTGPGGSSSTSVADPRVAAAVAVAASARNDDLGVLAFDEPAGAITGQGRPRTGRFSVADPRFAQGKRINWQQAYGVTGWATPAPVVTGKAGIHAGAYQVADPRLAAAQVALGCAPRAGAYRVLSWQEAAATITASLGIDNGAAAIADPRIDPDRPPTFTPLIVAADGTWHRPMTTLELAALQGLPTAIDGEPLVLAGKSHDRWREAIGNAVPPPAAAAIGSQLLKALLASKLGRFMLSSEDIWVAPFEHGGEAVPC